ncbi:MAG: hypothetical protein LBT46_08885 [Planctomycetaceae bacterium]|nr:hypothetical protein [Planctomycetaceae bacterium]
MKTKLKILLIWVYRILFYGFFMSLLLAVWIPGFWKVTATIVLLLITMFIFAFLSVLKKTLEDRKE